MFLDVYSIWQNPFRLQTIVKSIDRYNFFIYTVGACVGKK